LIIKNDENNLERRGSKTYEPFSYLEKVKEIVVN
jgi:hypothetical protein